MAGNGPQSADAPRATFGDELRREREIRGISLREIAEATKVSRRHLDAIERDDHRSLPAPVFARGFVREYSRYLGLDPDEMVTRYVHFTQSLHDPAIDEAPEPLRSDRPTGEIPRPYARVDRRVWVLLVLILLCVGALLGVRAWMGAREAAAAPATAPVEPTPAATEPEAAPPAVPDSGPARDDDPVDTTATPSVLTASSRYHGAGTPLAA